MRPEQSPAAERAAAWYYKTQYWPVQVVGDAVVLPLGRGVVAFDVPAERARLVQNVLDRSDNETAAVFVEAARPRVVFLAEADDSVFGQFQMPSGVRYMSVPVALRLPLLTALPPGDLSWFRPPDPARRWFPRAAAVLAAIMAATPYALRVGSTVVSAPRRERVLIG